MRQFNVGDKLSAEEVLAFLETTGDHETAEAVRGSLDTNGRFEIVEISVNQMETGSDPAVVGHHLDGSYKTYEGGYRQWLTQNSGSKRVKAIVPA